MLELTKTDLARLDNVRKALLKGKYELEGDEVLAFAQSFHWLNAHYERVKAALEAPLPPPAPETQAKTKGAKK